jgi:hypothetical protein
VGDGIVVFGIPMYVFRVGRLVPFLSIVWENHLVCVFGWLQTCVFVWVGMVIVVYKKGVEVVWEVFLDRSGCVGFETSSLLVE